MKYGGKNYRKHTSRNPFLAYSINAFNEQLVGFVCLANSKSVLDIGCGEGFTIEYLIKRLPSLNLVGGDISKESLNVAKGINRTVKFKQADVNNMPFEDGQFDLVICSEVLEHLGRPEVALDEINRVTNKYCILTVPNEPMFSLINFLRGNNIMLLGKSPHHRQFWSENEFVNFIQRTFEIIEIRKPLPWIMALCKKRKTK